MQLATGYGDARSALPIAWGFVVLPSRRASMPETVQMVRKYIAKKRKARVAIANLDKARKGAKSGQNGN